MTVTGFTAGLCLGLLSAALLAPPRPPDTAGTSPDTASVRARIAMQHPLPPLNGARLKLTQVEVIYPPGTSSHPHSHPCAVIGYVVAGQIRSQVRGERDSIFHAGDTFYEPPNGVHQVSSNASERNSATLLATFVCDSVVPLSAVVPDSTAGPARTP